MGKHVIRSGHVLLVGDDAPVGSEALRVVNLIREDTAAVGTAQTIGVELDNPTAATNVAQNQFSPAVALSGAVWDVGVPVNVPIRALLQAEGDTVYITNPRLALYLGPKTAEQKILTICGSGIRFAQRPDGYEETIYFNQEPALLAKDGSNWSINAQQGGQADPGVADGATGGSVYVNGAPGGDGTGGEMPGYGGDVVLNAGSPGADGGAGGRFGGSIWLDGSAGTGGESDGWVNIGTANTTSEVLIGNTHNNTLITQGGHGYVTLRGPVRIGDQAETWVDNQISEATVIGFGSGLAQKSRISVIGSSTDAASVELTMSGAAPGAGERLIIPSGKVCRFRIELACLCTAGTNVGAAATWCFDGAIKDIAGTTALVGVVALTNSFVDAALAAATAVVAASDPNDCLTITCTGIVGAAANTFHWHAAVYLSEVG